LVNITFLTQKHRLRTDNANEKNTFLGGLACSQEDWVLERFLGMALDESSGYNFNFAKKPL
jgi:hypothetical protein